MWTSQKTSMQCPDDDGGIVHLFNENTSWHGHTMMSIEYKDGTFWGLSFQPKEEGTGKANQVIYSVPATLINRTGYGQKDPGICGPISSKVLSYSITKAQKEELHKVVMKEENAIKAGTVTYAVVGKPVLGIFTPGYRDTCYSWTIRVLREAGIISSAWMMTRWLSMAPSTADLFGTEAK